jgi:hypothetical protein
LKSKFLKTASLAFVMALMIGGGIADAASTKPAQIAHYKSKTLTLSKGWGTAQSCVVVSSSDVQCFDSNKQADDYGVRHKIGIPDSGSTKADSVTSPNAMQSAAASLPSCSDGWMCLYQDINGGGRRLMFRDEGWQGLDTYGFAHQASSVRNNQSSSDLGCLGGYRNYNGSPYTICWSGKSYASYLGDTYNDTALDVGA